MPKESLNKEEKARELVKYRDLVLATLDWYIERYQSDKFYIDPNDAQKHQALQAMMLQQFSSLKAQVPEIYDKGQLTKLKQWFRDLTEEHIEERLLSFNTYLKNKTGYDIDIFQAYFQRIEAIIKKGKITTDNQYYDINNLVNELCQTDPVDSAKINVLNELLIQYEKKKQKR